ncbi:MAG: DinB family protein [Candidatus Odinarchaeota archaeon]
MSKSASGARREVERFSQFLEEVHSGLERAIDGLENVELNWRPSPSSNSIGNLLKHIIGSQAFWIHHVVGGMVTDRVRSAEFEVKDFDTSDLRKELSDVRKKTNLVLEKLTDAELEQMRSYWSQLAQCEKQVSVYWCLFHVIEHSALHIGQIFYARKMYVDLQS